LNAAAIATARAQVSAWLEANSDQLGWNHVATNSVEMPAATLTATYQGAHNLVNVTVWDHAFCLDILVLDSRTGVQLYSVGGSCEDAIGLSNRLSEFKRWLAKAPDAA